MGPQPDARSEPLRPGDLGKIRDSKTHFIVVERFHRPTLGGEDVPHVVAIINGIFEELPEFWLIQHAEVIDETR